MKEVNTVMHRLNLRRSYFSMEHALALRHTIHIIHGRTRFTAWSIME